LLNKILLIYYAYNTLTADRQSPKRRFRCFTRCHVSQNSDMYVLWDQSWVFIRRPTTEIA